MKWNQKEEILLKKFSKKGSPEISNIFGRLAVEDPDIQRRTPSAIRKKLATLDNRKILSISDLHFPFCRTELLYEVIRANQDADIVVVNGDMFDGYAFSTFTKDTYVNPITEYQNVFSLVKYLSDNFEKVVLVRGNHDSRSSKYLTKLMPKSTSEIFRPDLIARVANGEEIDEKGQLVALHKFKNVLYNHAEPWFAMIGKTIFAHPSGFKSGPGGTVVRLEELFNIRLGSDAYDSIVCAHTHRVLRMVLRRKLLMEQGCFASHLEYQFKEDMIFANAVNGYAVVYQDREGNTDFNKSNVFHLGTELKDIKRIL